MSDTSFSFNYFRRRLHPIRLSRTWRDALVLSGLTLGAFILLLNLDLADRFFTYSEQHEDWELDEIVVLVALSLVAATVFSARRLKDLRTELLGRHAAEETVRVQAMHDPLTGLANRRKLAEVLPRAIAAAKPAGGVTALMMIDLDRFKPINDLHGHQVGDQVLKIVAERLSAIMRKDELVSRLGGDEFAVLLPRVTDAADAGRPARRILQALEGGIDVDGLLCHVTASVGIAITPGAVGADTLMRQADIALYRAKREGRNQFRFFDETMDGEIQVRARLELDLRKALVAGEIRPHYQPLVDLADGRVTGYEILARWNHPTEGAIPPTTFIPIAEDTGLIGDLTVRILHQACIDSRRWPVDTMMALNISPLQLRDPFLADRLLSVLRDADFPPERLEVEITENALISDIDAARKALTALKAHGVSIALDDFGTGYSSLHHLRELPFDKLKIDRSFILTMETSDENRKIVDAIVGLGRSLGLVTIAEGVETLASAEHLKALGCDMAQGYFYGRPVPSEQTTAAPAPVGD